VFRRRSDHETRHHPHASPVSGGNVPDDIEAQSRHTPVVAADPAPSITQAGDTPDASDTRDGRRLSEGSPHLCRRRRQRHRLPFQRAWTTSLAALSPPKTDGCGRRTGLQRAYIMDAVDWEPCERAGSRSSASSTCPRATRRWSGLSRSPSHAAVLTSCTRSCPIRRWATDSGCLPDLTFRSRARLRNTGSRRHRALGGSTRAAGSALDPRSPISIDNALRIGVLWSVEAVVAQGQPPRMRRINTARIRTSAAPAGTSFALFIGSHRDSEGAAAGSDDLGCPATLGGTSLRGQPKAGQSERRFGGDSRV
jgi:hypothetical protein